MWLYIERRGQLQAAGNMKLLELLDEAALDGHEAWRENLP